MIPANKKASYEKCGHPYTSHCVWAEGINRLPSLICTSHRMHGLDLMVNATLQYLEERASSKKPFYLFQSFTTPHAGGIGNVSEPVFIQHFNTHL